MEEIITSADLMSFGQDSMLDNKINTISMMKKNKCLVYHSRDI